MSDMGTIKTVRLSHIFRSFRISTLSMSMCPEPAKCSASGQVEPDLEITAKHTLNTNKLSKIKRT